MIVVGAIVRGRRHGDAGQSGTGMLELLYEVMNVQPSEREAILYICLALT